MKETSKAMRRRWCEDAEGLFHWKTLFTGRGIDVGSGDDPVKLPGCATFDVADGDANRLNEHVPAQSFDWLHASQCLEHMHNPVEAIRNWLSVVKPGGHAIITVPDWLAYEHMHWPSVFNPDHKSTWSLVFRKSTAPVHVHVPSFLIDLRDVAETKLCRMALAGYNPNLPDSVDQTFPEDGAECFIEFVLQAK